MKILNPEQIRAWDTFTIQQEPVSSFGLMERAAGECAAWIIENIHNHTYKIFCGQGNNGGDGLVLARLLLAKGYQVQVYILEGSKQGTDEFQTGLQQLRTVSTAIHFIQSTEQFPAIDKMDVVIDALIGSGLNKALQGLHAQLVNFINESEALLISIDVPSGLFINQSSAGHVIIKANHTLTFQCQKLGLLMAENASYLGDVYVLNIGLHPQYEDLVSTPYYFIDSEIIKETFKKRRRFGHKGTFGHALMIAGSYGKIGAGMLAVQSCLHTGIGLMTCHIPKCGYQIMQTAIPETMVITDEELNHITSVNLEVNKYDAIGIGPGIGTADETQQAVVRLIKDVNVPVVIDADGLNCLSLHKEVLEQLPKNTVLTPHPKEFDRLFGNHQTDFERMETAIKKARDFNTVIVLKGHHTLVATPEGKAYFNSTGNAGMATGGSGDVLTGIICSLLAQGYNAGKAAILGVYLHGLAGDFAANALSQESMIASDIITYLPSVFLKLNDLIRERIF